QAYPGFRHIICDILSAVSHIEKMFKLKRIESKCYSTVTDLKPYILKRRKEEDQGDLTAATVELVTNYFKRCKGNTGSIISLTSDMAFILKLFSSKHLTIGTVRQQ
ncbi:hypothetical protein L9F63_015513, partial [Diploptera punctata]